MQCLSMDFYCLFHLAFAPPGSHAIYSYVLLQQACIPSIKSCPTEAEAGSIYGFMKKRVEMLCLSLSIISFAYTVMVCVEVTVVDYLGLLDRSIW